MNSTRQLIMKILIKFHRKVGKEIARNKVRSLQCKLPLVNIWSSTSTCIQHSLNEQIFIL